MLKITILIIRGNNIRRWTRGLCYDILVKNLASFWILPKYLLESKLTRILTCLAKESLEQKYVESVLWWILVILI